MARPTKDKEHKLSETVTFRLTEGELKKLEHWSIACGKHLAVMIRQKLFTGKYPKTVLPKVTVDLYAELNRIGVNINQLTKQVNAGRLPTSLRAVLNAVADQQQKIINQLLDDRG